MHKVTHLLHFFITLDKIKLYACMFTLLCFVFCCLFTLILVLCIYNIVFNNFYFYIFSLHLMCLSFHQILYFSLVILVCCQGNILSLSLYFCLFFIYLNISICSSSNVF